MSKWRVLIADDEPAARRGVRQLLAPFHDFEVVGEARDGREVLAALPALRPDVLFLDIRMPELDGFGVTRRRPSDAAPLVVFLTAYEQFALEAFDADATDYLVKPVSEARFAATIARLERRLRGDSTASEEASLTVVSTRGLVVVPIRDIDWIEAADYYVRLWVGGRSHLLRDSLDHLERRMASHGFLRAHRGALVRVDGVRAIRATRSGAVVAVLACGATVPVARRRRGALVGAVRNKGS